MASHTKSLLLLLFLLPLLSACRSNKQQGELSDEEKIDLYYERALRYYEMRELDRCQDQVQRGLALDNDNEGLLLVLGRCYQTRGDLEGVLAAERIFRGLPDTIYQVPLCLGGSLERKGVFFAQAAEKVASGEQYTEAVDPQARALELAQSAEDAWKEADTRYQRALKLFPGSFEALNGLMRTAVYRKEYDASMEWSTKFLTTISESSSLFRKRLKDLEMKGEATVKVEKTLLENADLELQVRLHRAELLNLKGQTRDSLAELDRAMAIDEDVAEVYARRGQLLQKLGEHQRAIDSLQRFMSLSDHPFDHPNIRQAFDRIEECKRAMRHSVDKPEDQDR